MHGMCSRVMYAPASDDDLNAGDSVYLTPLQCFQTLSHPKLRAARPSSESTESDIDGGKPLGKFDKGNTGGVQVVLPRRNTYRIVPVESAG